MPKNGPFVASSGIDQGCVDLFRRNAYRVWEVGLGLVCLGLRSAGSDDCCFGLIRPEWGILHDRQRDKESLLKRPVKEMGDR
jgi:hypothetical protein